MFLRMMMKTFLFLPAYALLMIGFFVYPHHPPSFSCCTCKPSFCITHFVCFYPHLHLQNHPFTKYSVFHILAVFIRALPSRPPPLAKPSVHETYCISHFVCFSHFWPANITELAKSLTITRQKKPRTHPSYNKCNQILFYIVKVSLSRFDPYFIHISHIYCLPVQCAYVRNNFFQLCHSAKTGVHINHHDISSIHVFCLPFLIMIPMYLYNTPYVPHIAHCTHTHTHGRER